MEEVLCQRLKLATKILFFSIPYFKRDIVGNDLKCKIPHRLFYLSS